MKILSKTYSTKRKIIKKGEIIKQVSKYFNIALINFKNSFVYLTDTFGSAAFIGIIVFIYAMLWTTIFSINGETIISGFTLPMMVWYLVLTEAIVTAQGHLIEKIGDEVKTGEIANYLNKPYNYLFYKYFSILGETSTSFLLKFIIGGIIALIIVGPINIRIEFIPIIAISAFFGITLNFLFAFNLGILSFWLEESKALHFLYQKMVFVLGGMLVPLEIFPELVKEISLLLPFSYISYYPAKLFVQQNTLVLGAILFQFIWIIILLITGLIVFNKLSKRLSINGG